MTSTYEDSMTLDMDILELRLARENNVEIENYMYGEGTFSGSAEDPSTGTPVTTAGDVYFTSELLGNDNKKNWAAEEFSCSIQRTNITLDGDIWLIGSGLKTPIKSTVVNTTWNVNYEKYTNVTIYYEYTYNYSVANLEFYDEGSGYPEGHPTHAESEIHIEQALTFNTGRPRVLTKSDVVLLESEHGVKLTLTATTEVVATVNGKKYDCLDIKGEFVEGATGSMNIRIIRSGTYAGLSVNAVEEIYWGEEWVKGNVKLKRIKG